MPNTGEKNNRAEVNRRRSRPGAAGRWLESNEVTHWPCLQIIFALARKEPDRLSSHTLRLPLQCSL